MTKLVNVILQGRAITALKQPITRNISNVYLSTEDIKAILEAKNGIVREVFPDGSVLDLTLENYDKPNLFEEFKKKKEQAKIEAKTTALEERKFQESLQEKRNKRNQNIQALMGAPRPPQFKASASIAPEKPSVDVDSIRAKIEQNKQINA